MPQNPGRSDRQGVSLVELIGMFPDEPSARRWFEETRWPNGERYCPHCGSMDRVQEVPNEKPMPYRCGDCRKYFSVRTGTAMERSHIPLHKWAIGIYLMCTNLKGVSSMKLHRDLNIRQPSAWFMAHRIRKAWEQDFGLFCGPVEVDETYVGGRRRNMRRQRREELASRGRGASTMAPVVGARDRDTNQVEARAIERPDGPTLRSFVQERAAPGATVYTDGSSSYSGLPGMDHEAVQHGVGEYVRGQAHTNGIESFWSMLKRGFYGTYHKMSVKHLQRYITEFAGRHNIRDLDTIKQMAAIAHGMGGKRLTYRQLIGQQESVV